jgi:transcriptional regulator with XRE-family HTH domain
MDIRKQFGKKLKELRLKQGLSQEKLAELCNLHRTYISSVERGKRNISLLNIEKIAKALNVDPNILLSKKVQ